MIDQKGYLEFLKKNKVNFISGVPDTLLNEFCLTVLNSWDQETHVIAANEGNAIAIAAGYQLSQGGVPLVYMQNSGMGNIINPLLSLTNPEVYSIPMLLLIGWRGNPDVKDHAQHKKQGILTPKLLETMNIPYEILEDDGSDAEAKTFKAIKLALEKSSPVGLIAKKGVFEKGEKEDLSKLESQLDLFREDVIEALIETLPKDTLFIASTGRATRELYYLRKSRMESHENDFLNVGAMGHALSIATGIAIANSHRKVVCLDGDAAAIMHMGSMSVTGQLNLPNLIHVVMNNGVHESVGGQPSVGFQTDFTAIAKASGYNTPESYINSKREITQFLSSLPEVSGSATFMDIHIRKGMRSVLPPLDIDPLELKSELRRSLGNNE